MSSMFDNPKQQYFAPPSASVNKEEAPIPQELRYLNAAQCGTFDLLDTLAGKLMSVLSESGPVPDVGTAKMPIASSLHSEIQQATDKQNGINKALREYIDRITL